MADLVHILGDMRIEPIGGEIGKSRWTEHRVIGEVDTGQPPSTQHVVADSAVPQYTAVERAAIRSEKDDLEGAMPVVPVEDSEGVSSQTSFDVETYVDVGDQVQIVFQDEPDRKIAVTISAREHDPGNFVVHQSKPLAAALLGHVVDDEVEVRLDANRVRTAVIVRIEKEVEQMQVH